MYKIAAVIVTYNRKDKLLKCIEAVMRQTAGAQLDVIVVDNNSSDGTLECIRQYAEENRIFLSDGSITCEQDNRSLRRVQYHDLGYNSGGAGGFCWGVRKAVEAGYDHVWLMDDDCIPADDALEAFLDYDTIVGGEYGFLSGQALWRDGSLCEMNLQRETVFRDVRRIPDEPMQVEMASFVSLFVPSSVVIDVGLPIRKFFIWTDDWEYTRRISRKYPCWLVPASKVVHDCDINSGADISRAKDERIDRFRYLYRNDVYLYRREGFRGFMYEAARLAVHAARIAVSRNGLSEKRRRIGIMLKGTAEGLRFYPEPERAYIEGKRK